MRTFYAIRKVGTDQYLQAGLGRSGRGQTHMEFTAMHAPRLYTRRQDAVVSVNWWLKGVVSAKYDWDSEMISMDTKRMPKRRKANCEIVELKLVPITYERLS